MKRRLNQSNRPPPPGPGTGTITNGRQRLHDPRGFTRGGGGPPNIHRGGPPGFPGRGGGRTPMNMGFQGRGGPRPGRVNHGPNMQNRGPQFGNFQGRSPIGRVRPSMGGRRGNIMMGRGANNMMGRGVNNMMGRGPMPGRPQMMGRGHPSPGRLLSSSNIPPPLPPRGPMGYQLPGGMRQPQQQQLHGLSSPPLRGNQTPTRMLNNNTRPPHTQFQQHQQFQHANPPNFPGVLPQIGGSAPKTFQANHVNLRQVSAQGSRLPPGVVPNYTPPSATYSDVPIASAAATTTTSQNLIAMGHLVQQQTTQGNAQKPRADQIDQAWKEYTAPNGMKYYHNAILKESTYTKPLTLTKREATSSTPKAREKRKWQEYADAASGKKYYSDGVSTTWEKPTGFDSDTVKPVRSIEETEQTKKKKKSASKNETSFSSKEEAIAAFKGLLLAKGIVPTIKWNEVAKICSLDSRWEACEDVLTVGERRQGLAEYQTKRANELKSLERQERIRAKDAFGQLLTDILPKISGFSARNSKFTDVRNSLAKDGRFHAVAAEETRARLFLDFCEEFRKRDERKKRNKKRETQDAFLSFLGEKEEAGTLTFASTWDSFFSSLNEKEKKDERFNLSAKMSDSDRHLYFADFVIELQSIEDDKRRRIRDARRRAEKAQREAYRELLKKLGSERKILPSTRWRSIEEVVSMNEPFNLVQAQDRDSPRALFEEFVGEWDDVYHRDRSFLSRLLHPNNRKEIIIEAGTSYEEFTKLLLDEAALSQEVYGDTRRIINSQEPISSAHLYHDELISLAVENERRTSGRRRTDEESSEDEGEIIEDEESPAVDDGDCDKPSSDGALPEAKSHVELAEKDSQEFSKKSKSDARLVREALVEGKEREDSSKNTEISQKITESGLEKELQEKGESR